MATINLGIKTSVDLQGIIQLKKQIQELQNMLKNPYGESILSGSFSAKEIQQTINAVNALDRALDSAFDVNLNSINIDKFNKSLKNSNMNIASLYKDLSRMGVEGQKAFIHMTQASLTMGHSIKQTNEFVESMKTTFANTVKWGISSGLWNTMLQSVSKAFTYVKGLNADLNDIRIVTGKSADQMERFAKQANRAAKDLAVSTRDYTQGALIYYQQGLSDEEVATRTNVTAKASNVTGQDMSTVSEQLTAVWNGYQVANQAAKEGMDIYEQYVDKMTAVAASTASDLEEQATAMSKVASAAYSMGVGFDELNAQISTIVSVTRQAPESVGTALKTIYARLGDLQVDGVDEFGTSLGDVSGKLQTMGIEVMDSNGQMREMDDVMTEVAAKWNTWTDAQKQAAAVAMAGKRQYNNLIALFDNWDMYGESLKTSMESAGTLSEQQSIALDSLENKMEKMQTTAEKFYDALFDEESIGGIVDGLTGLLDLLGSLTQGMGGLKSILPIVGGMALKFFSKDIGDNITKGVINLKNISNEVSNDQSKQELAKILGDKATFLDSNDDRTQKEAEKLVSQYQSLIKYKKIMNEEDLKNVEYLSLEQAKISDKILTLEKEKQQLRERNELVQEYYKEIENADITEEEKKDKTNAYQKQILIQESAANTFLEQTVSFSDIKDNATAIEETIEGGIGRDLFGEDTGASVKFAERITKELINMKKAGKPVEEQINFINKEIKKFGEEGKKITPKSLKMLNEALKDTETAAEEAWSTILDGSKIIKKLDVKTLEKIKVEFKKLVNQGYSAEEAFEKAGQAVADEATKARKLANELDQVENAQDRVNEAQKQFQESMALKNAISGITEFAGGISTVAGSLSGIFNAFQVGFDTSLSSSERFKASIMGLVTSIPMLIQGYTQLTQGLRTFTGLTEAATLAQLKDKAVTKANALANQFFTNTQLGRNLASLLGIQTTTAETAAETTETAATYDQAAANIALQATMPPLLAITLIIIIAIAALVAIVLAVTAAINAYTEKVQKNSEAAEENLEKQKALTEAAREEKQAIEEVSSAYEDLAKQYEDGTLSIDELRTKTYDLCMQYDLQDLAVKALTSDYETLNEVMKEAQLEADKSLKSSLAVEEDARNKSIAAKFAVDNLKGNTSRFDDGGKSIDLNDTGDYFGWGALNQATGGWSGLVRNMQTAETAGGAAGYAIAHVLTAGLSTQSIGDKREQKEAESLAATLEEFGLEIENGHVDSEAFFKAATTNYEEMLEALRNEQSDEAELLVKALVDNEEAIKENSAIIKEQQDLAKSITAREVYEKDNVSSVDEYNKEVEKLALALVAENEEEGYYTGSTEEIYSQAMEDAKKMLSEYSNANKWGQQAAIIEQVQSAKGSTEGAFSSDKLEESLAGSSLAERQFIQENIDLVVRYDSIDEALEAYKETIDFMNSKNFNVVINTVLEDKEITQEKIDEIYDNYTNFAKKTGIKKEDFEAMDYSQQSNAMMQYYIETQHAAISSKDEVVKAKNEELQAINEEYEKAKQEQYQKDLELKEQYANNIISNLTTSISKYDETGKKIGEFTEEDIKKMLDQTSDRLSNFSLEEIKGMISQKDWIDSGFTSEEASFLNQLMTNSGEFAADDLKEFVNNADPQIKTIEEYENSINSIKKAIQNAEEATISYTEQQEAFNAMMENNNADIDNLQNSYSDLIDVVSEYNDQGFLTIDTMQKLINMDSGTLAALQWDEATNSMSLNTEYMKNNLIAKLEDTKATIQQEGAVKLLALAEDDHTFSTKLNTLAQRLNADASLDAATAAKDAAEFWNQAVKELGGTSQEAALVVEETNKKLQAVDNTIAHINENPLAMITGDIVDSDDLDKLEDVVDRYWEINHALGKIERTMEDLERVQDKLHGQELIDSLKTENKLIEEQGEAYKKLLEEQQEEASEIKGKLGNLGVDFYDNGEIANYEEAMTAALNRYNAIASSGNYSDTAKEDAEKQYEEFKEYMERYDELFYEEIEDTLDNIEDNKMAILENNLEAWEVELEVKLEKQQFERDWNDFKKELDSDFTLEFENLNPTFTALEDNIKTYTEGTLSANLEVIKQIETEILKLDAGEESTMFASISQAQEKLKELIENSQGDALDLKDLYQEAWDTYIEGIDQSAEKFEKITSEHERIAEQLEYEQELIELIYGEEAYSKMDNLYKAQEQNTLAQINNFKSQVDIWQEFYDNAEEGSADQARYYELLNEAQSSLNESLITYIDLLKNDYLNTINSILQTFEKGITGGSSLDDLSEQWDRMKEKSDKYFDSVESLYEIQSFANNIQMSIDETTTLKNQQKLQALYDREIEYLREKENLTQYDLDAAEARYQIALKEIALEEAQNAKNSMKLTRGADGNWSYQYVADQDDILAKQQDLAASYNDLYQLANSAYEENLDSLIQLQADYEESALAIANNDLLDEEQKQIKFEELRREYLDKYKLLAQENTLYRNDLNLASSALLFNLYNQDEKNYEKMTEAEKALTEGLKIANIKDFSELQTKLEENYDGIGDKAETVMGETLDSWTSGAQDIANAWNSDEGESVKVEVNKAIDAMQTAWDTYQTKVEKGAESAGKKVSDLGTDYSNVTIAVQGLQSATETLVTKTTELLGGYQTTVQGMAGVWNSVKTSVEGALEEAKKYFDYVGTYKGQDINFDHGEAITGNKDGWDTSGDLYGSGGSNTSPSGGKEVTVYAGTSKSSKIASMNSDQLSISKNISATSKEGNFYWVSGGGVSGYIAEEDYQKIYGKTGGKAPTTNNKTFSFKQSNTGGSTSYVSLSDIERLNYGATWDVSEGHEDQLYPVYVATSDNRHGWMTIEDAIATGKLPFSEQQEMEEYRSSEKYLQYKKKKDLKAGGYTGPSSFDTGGYTGDWGTSDGRLAMLHQKELVLNQKDTENILNTVQAVRSIESGIMNKINSMLLGLSSLTQSDYIPAIAGGNSTTDNVFNITAEFPNANDVTSIREAILSLPNIASQYIAENKK